MTCSSEAKVLGSSMVALLPSELHTRIRNTTDGETRCVSMNSSAGYERAMAAVREASQKGATPEEIYELAVTGGFIFHAIDDRGGKRQ